MAETKGSPSGRKEHPSRDRSSSDVTVLMRKITEHTVGRTEGAWPWSSRIVRITKVLEGILFLALLYNPLQALSVALPSPYGVTLAWDHSPSPEVAGYRVHYGETSGNYSNSVAVGYVTTNRIAGLANGVTYYFAVTAYDMNGVESPFSNEISYRPGLPAIGIGVVSNGEVVLTVKGLIGQVYDIEATEDFTAWTVIATVTLGAEGSLDFTDKSATNFAKRFYRTQQKP